MNTRLSLVLAFVLLAASLTGLSAQSGTFDPQKIGPQVGQRVPDFSAPDQKGETRTLQSLLGPNGAIVLFNRSVDW
ncbi:MAG: hypothetical protein HY654_00745 [Acidobacteria bacterium]|nr:hypothetical protein [Acidobacteriota bacterium]